MLAVRYDEDSTDHYEAVRKVMKLCRKENLKLNIDKCHLMYMNIPFFGEIVSRYGVQPDPHKVYVLIKMTT